MTIHANIIIFFSYGIVCGDWVDKPNKHCKIFDVCFGKFFGL
jgi:hypothetical protein